MEWIFSNKEMHEIIEDLKDPSRDADGNMYKPIRARVRGRQFWTVRETTLNDGSMVREIVMYQLKIMGDLRGYKEVKEKDGLKYYSCPLPFLALTTPVDNDWRQKVESNYVYEVK